MAIAQKLSESESTLTSRYQTTIPQMVRRILGLDKNDKIKYTVLQNGSILLSRAERDEIDPVLDQFLNFLANDIGNNPQNVREINADLVQRADSLVSGLNIDLNSPLLDEDE